MKNVSVKISKRLSHLKNFRHQSRVYRHFKSISFKSYIAVQETINSVLPDSEDKSSSVWLLRLVTYTQGAQD